MSKTVIMAVVLVGMVGVVEADSIWGLGSNGTVLQKGRDTLQIPAQADVSCRDDVKHYIDKGAKPTETFTSEGLQWVPKAYKDKENDDKWTTTLANAGLLCDEIAKIVVFHPAMQSIYYAALDVANFERQTKRGGPEQNEMSEAVVARLMVEKKACRTAVPVVQAAAATYGIKSLRFGIGQNETEPMEIATLSSLCDAFDRGMVAYEKANEDNDKALQEEWDKAEAPYKKAGAKGEKLEFLTKMDGTAIRGVGGRELTTPKAKVAATLMFEVLSGSGSFTVRRYTWKGNKSTGVTQRDYDRQPGAAAFK